MYLYNAFVKSFPLLDTMQIYMELARKIIRYILRVIHVQHKSSFARTILITT